MLYEFLKDHEDELIARARAKVMSRFSGVPTELELQNGVPLFLKQLADRLRLETSDNAAIEQSASQHGGELHRLGFTVGQVVHGYGDVCQAVTELALETDAPVTTDEFRTLNRCLDDAIAEAVTEYVRTRDQAVADQGRERSGIVVHELRNRLNAAMLSLSILKKGNVGIGGSTGAVLGRSLEGMRDLLSKSLTEGRLAAGLECRQRVAVFEFIEEMEIEASLVATSRGVQFAVDSHVEGVDVWVDPQLLISAVSNLLLNAFKFTLPSTRVSLRANATTTRVVLDVEDECGGLPPGKAEDMFPAFQQKGTDRSGLGLGLTISRRAIEACGGSVSVRDLPGKGCIFTIDIPRLPA